MKYKIAKQAIRFFLLVLLVLPTSLNAAMQSDSYIIYENVLHTFDGPIISNIVCTAGVEQVTVTWDTNVIADSFVVYDTDSSLTNSMEQGSSVKNSTSHSVVVTGLNGGTAIYYQVKSERVNGGVTQNSTTGSCTPTADTSGITPDPPSSGGGILIIDKTDKFAPEISDTEVIEVTSESAIITWTTNEEATSFVEYGTTIEYGHTYGEWSSTTAHTVTLNNLQEATAYNFRALSSDMSGNLTRGENLNFTTLLIGPDGEEIVPEEPEEPGSEDDIPEFITEGDPETILASATETIIELLNRFSSQVSINVLETTLNTQFDTIRQIADIIPAPILSGEPRVEVGVDNATIFWTTDKESTSMVAVASDENYNPDAGEAYSQVSGNPEAVTTEHAVEIIGLDADTLYHYQLRSKPELGPTGISIDFTFRTRLEALEISSFYTTVVDNQTASFKWVTNKDSDSAVTFIPYRGNTLSVEEAKTIKDNALTVIHEITINEFVEGTIYQVELSSQDSVGNLASELFPSFVTSEDDNPPIISHIQTDSTIFVDRGGKVQTIISWRTNEPCTTRIFYQEGVHSSDEELMEKTNLNTNYTKEHVVVITKFQPGLVYSFRSESIDSGGNVAMSKVHTFMTPKQKESIIQVIMRILEDTFSWVNKLR